MCCTYVANATPIRATIPPTVPAHHFARRFGLARWSDGAALFAKPPPRTLDEDDAARRYRHFVHEIEIRFEAVRQGLSAVFATSPAFD
jgi:hypothetical protein